MLSLTEIQQFFHGEIKLGEPVARYSQLGVGGPADYLFEASTVKEVEDLTAYFQRTQIPYIVLQQMMLVSDAGFRGAVISPTNLSMGSEKTMPMFKSLPDISVAAVIRDAHVNGILWGGAEIVGDSVANVNRATAADIHALVTHAQRIIRDRCHVHLELGFELVGFNQENLAQVA